MVRLHNAAVNTVSAHHVGPLSVRGLELQKNPLVSKWSNSS